LGIPLFLTGLAGLITAIVLVNRGEATWHLILWAFGATMTGLATFGNHNENAVAWMLKSESTELSPKMKAELTEEMTHDRLGVLGTQPTPKLAAFVTVLALLAQSLAGYKLWQVL
jgi:hypothetical protein